MPPLTRYGLVKLSRPMREPNRRAVIVLLNSWSRTFRRCGLKKRAEAGCRASGERACQKPQSIVGTPKCVSRMPK
jgi:hypothetical protein